MNLKGKYVILNENKDNKYLLVSISNNELIQIKKMITNAIHNVPYQDIIDELGITPVQILAYGEGNPSHRLLAKILHPIGSHEGNNMFPCFCNYETDPIKRCHDLLDPVLHENVESSFICARERLLYPDYTVILKINKNGKEIKTDSDTITEKV